MKRAERRFDKRVKIGNRESLAPHWMSVRERRQDDGKNGVRAFRQHDSWLSASKQHTSKREAERESSESKEWGESPWD